MRWDHSMTKRRSWAWACALLAVLLVGCSPSIVGQWRSIEPSEGPPEVPRLREVEFNKDGQFQGRMVRSGRIVRLTGTYEFDGRRLFLTPDAGMVGGTQVYRVEPVGSILLLSADNVTTRLCREASSAASRGAAEAGMEVVPASVGMADAAASQPG